MLPTISVVTINYCRLADLKATFASVVGQTYPKVEYIIIDGGSTDGSVEFLRDHREQIDHWVSERDQGIYDAMNKGAAAATGEWIIFMNAGDAFMKETTLDECAPYLSEEVDIVYGGVQVVLTDRYQTRIYRRSPRPLTELWREMPACHQSIFVRRGLQTSFGFDSSMKWCADHDLLVRLYQQGYSFQQIPVIVAKFDAASAESKNALTYTKERWRNSRYLAGPWKRHSYFAWEYLNILVWQSLVRPLRNSMPPKWVMEFRRLRDTRGMIS